MASLDKVWINYNDICGMEIRVDWSNDRHHAVKIEDNTPEAIVDALMRMSYLIKMDIHNKEL